MTRRHALSLGALLLTAGTIGTVAYRQHPVEHATNAPSATRATSAADGTAAPERAPITIDARRQQLIGVRTVTVHQAEMAPDIRAAGTVTYDETRQSEISTRVDGWIRDLLADYTGRTIRRGDTLFTLYSPDVIATENEYLLAVRGRSMPSGHDDQVHAFAERLVDAARERLLRLDVSDDDVTALEASGRAPETMTFRAPVSGTIVEKAAVRGMRVTAGQTLYRIADLSTVWVEAEIAQSDLSLVRTGMSAVVTVDAYPARSFDGRVAYVYPTISEQTRTARIRLTLPNRDGLLKPNMLATVVLAPTASRALIAPTDAVVDTGSDHVVFVAEGDGRFSPRHVRVGRRAGGQVEILSGLDDGEHVAASATFFLDSESQLRGALQDYAAPAGGGDTTAQPAPADHAFAVTFRTEPDPPKVGETTVVVTVSRDGVPVTDVDVAVVFMMPPMPSMNMPALRTDARLVAAGGGTYRGTAAVIAGGEWDVTVTVRRNGQPLATRQFTTSARVGS